LTHLLERRQFVAAPLAEVFAFFRNPRNLEAITPPWLGFKIVEASDEEVRHGSGIEYRLRWHRLPIQWKSLITEYHEPDRFADTMVSGPYKHWHHRHIFTALGNGVEIHDSVEYELPLGPVGRLIHRTLVRRQLEEIFDYRQTRIGEIFSPAVTTPIHLIVLAHGSSDPAWRVPVDALANRLRSELVAASVGIAFLERMSPALDVAIASAARKGAQRILVLPLFVAPGKHLRYDVPRYLERILDTHPGVRVTVLPAVGEDQRFTNAVVNIATAALADQLPSSTALRSASMRSSS